MKVKSSHPCLLLFFATLLHFPLRSEAASSIVDDLGAHNADTEKDQRSEEVRDAYALANRGLNELALAKFKQAAAKEDVDAYVALGIMHREGIGTEKSIELAKENFGKAAAKGNRNAKDELALLGFTSPESEEEFKEASKHLEQLAGEGMAVAQLRLGQAYLAGYGFPADAEKGIDLLTKAANSQGPFEPEAEYVLGQLYLGGSREPEVKPDPSLAVKWLGAAADSDHAAAQRALGELLIGQDPDVRDYGRARVLFSRLEKLGDPHGAYYQGLMSENGWGGEKDPANALECYRRAAEKDVPAAVYGLAVFHQEGLGGLEKDKDKALEYYRKGAELGHGISMYNLSVLLDSEDGSKEVAEEKIGLLFGAAATGLVQAEYMIGIGYQQGSGVPQDFVAAAAWFDRAARSGHAQAQLSLGEMYEAGLGVNQDPVAARRLYELSAKGGDTAGRFRYAGSLANGIGGESDLPEAYLHVTVAAETATEDTPLSKLAIKMREDLEKIMTPDQMTEAKKRLSASKEVSPTKD